MADQSGAGGEPKVCLRCGKLVSPHDAFCVSCGADLKASPLTGQAGSVSPSDFAHSRPKPETAGTTPGTQAGYMPMPPGAYGGQYPQTGASPPLAAYPQAPPAAYPGYQAPVPYYYAPYYPPGSALKKNDDLAIASLICALCSYIVIPLLPAVAAIILGFISREHIRKNPAQLGGEGMALAGILLGMVNILIIVAAIVLILATVP